MKKENVEQSYKSAVTFVCPNCHNPVVWEDVTFSDGSVFKAPNWTCKYCSMEVLALYADLYQMHKQ